MQSAKLQFGYMAVSLFVCLAVSSSPALSQTPSVAPPAEPKAVTPAQPPTKLVAPSAEECLVRVRGFEPTLMRLKETCKSTISAIIPDPAAYEKTLPAFEKVIADKDAKNLRN